MDLRDFPKGEVVFVDHGWRDGKDVLYKSRQFANPTWEEVLRCCDESIYTREDFHHVFLESLYTLAVREGVTYIRFSFGS